MTVIIIIIIIIITIITTQYSKLQFKICFNKVIGFLKNSTSLNTGLAAKTHSALGEFSSSKIKEWFLTLHTGTLIPVASKTSCHIKYKALILKDPRKYQKH
jgi:hypothetical protein